MYICGESAGSTAASSDCTAFMACATDGRCVGVCAPEPHDEGAHHLPIVAVVARPQPCVRRVEGQALAVEAPHPPEQREGRFLPASWQPAGDDLQQDDAEAVDVGVGAPLERVDELWVDVPHGALHKPCGLWTGAVVDEAGETELGVVRRVEHYVPGFDVTVHDALLPIHVQIYNAPFRHELVDEQEPFGAVTPAQELHKVTMPQPAYDPHLGLELLPSLRGRLR
ncbi:LOW QUALITY PROTEIN: hypothetical protein U9M48_002534 [Paspalum notatum var. saurae]|uniref:Uncharacterized protein n=1 Tax=Paspalum notatum var. saurae TaxID=547442 RepID=A0AAQ3PR40_PASNO